jgi:hypothetical protein
MDLPLECYEMPLANQTFYFSILVVLLGLMAGFFSRQEGYRAAKLSLFWPSSLLLLAISMGSFFVAAWGIPLFLVIANISLTASVICMTLLFRSWRGPITKMALAMAIIGFALCTITYVYLLNNGTTNDQIYLLNGILIAASVLQLIQLFSLPSHQIRFHQIKILIGIEILEIAVRSLRSLHLYFSPETNLVSLYQEGGLGFSLRVISVLLLLMTCVLITNYYLETLWKEHRNNAQAIESGMLRSLNALSMVRDNETGNHILRTQHYVERLARQMKSMGLHHKELSEAAIDRMKKAAPLHDIGKVGIPDDILKKNGPLNDEEWTVMKTHASLGENVLNAAKRDDTKHAKVLDVAIEIAGSHHENWDGSGYPRGLKGEEIPLSARIMALADMYDALVSERVYKNKWSHEEACAEILRNQGKRFDPMVVEAFIQEQHFFDDIAKRYGDV